MRRFLSCMLMAVVVAGVAGCGAAKPSKYYALDLPGTRPAGGNTYPVSLLVGRISAPHLYRNDRLVYRTGDTQIGTYEYHRWAEPPSEMVEAILLRMLRASGKFATVQRQASNTQGDYIVRGRLHQFEEVAGTSLQARVTFELELYDQKTGTTAWTHFYSQDEPVTGKGVPDVVQALNRNIQRGLTEATDSLDRFFATRK
jgi:ABC-type uncharacterized transport system auxiliary subunit